eukprot:TRINITY_DN109062_c0_g1_i1.p1 TRINITY_DN109062_c0_g1~~TRINITY_DN109062_c0_g1_i1.p1  ORF type:complete len:951 (+),score=201.23 TRINITY_DN109062_c0_g1_i1:104-2956(+)
MSVVVKNSSSRSPSFSVGKSPAAFLRRPSDGHDGFKASSKEKLMRRSSKLDLRRSSVAAAHRTSCVRAEGLDLTVLGHGADSEHRAIVPVLLEVQIPGLDLNMKISWNLDASQRQSLAKDFLDAVRDHIDDELAMRGFEAHSVEGEDEAERVMKVAKEEVNKLRKKAWLAHQAQQQAKERVEKMRAQFMQQVVALKEQLRSEQGVDFLENTTFNKIFTAGDAMDEIAEEATKREAGDVTAEDSSRQEQQQELRSQMMARMQRMDTMNSMADVQEDLRTATSSGSKWRGYQPVQRSKATKSQSDQAVQCTLLDSPSTGNLPDGQVILPKTARPISSSQHGEAHQDRCADEDRQVPVTDAGAPSGSTDAVAHCTDGKANDTARSDSKDGHTSTDSADIQDVGCTVSGAASESCDRDVDVGATANDPVVDVSIDASDAATGPIPIPSPDDAGSNSINDTAVPNLDGDAILNANDCTLIPSPIGDAALQDIPDAPPSSPAGSAIPNASDDTLIPDPAGDASPDVSNDISASSCTDDAVPSGNHGTDAASVGNKLVRGNLPDLKKTKGQKVLKKLGHSKSSDRLSGDEIVQGLGYDKIMAKSGSTGSLSEVLEEGASPWEEGASPCESNFGLSWSMESSPTPYASAAVEESGEEVASEEKPRALAMSSSVEDLLRKHGIIREARDSLVVAKASTCRQTRPSCIVVKFSDDCGYDLAEAVSPRWSPSPPRGTPSPSDKLTQALPVPPAGKPPNAGAPHPRRIKAPNASGVVDLSGVELPSLTSSEGLIHMSSKHSWEVGVRWSPVAAGLSLATTDQLCIAGGNCPNSQSQSQCARSSPKVMSASALRLDQITTELSSMSPSPCQSVAVVGGSPRFAAASRGVLPGAFNPAPVVEKSPAPAPPAAALPVKAPAPPLGQRIYRVPKPCRLIGRYGKEFCFEIEDKAVYEATPTDPSLL